MNDLKYANGAVERAIDDLDNVITVLVTIAACDLEQREMRAIARCSFETVRRLRRDLRDIFPISVSAPADVASAKGRD